MDAINLLVSDSHGIYLPQTFVNSYDTTMWNGIDQEDVDIINLGPDHEHYWDAWNNILDNATYQHQGNTYQLWQEGDLFAICIEAMGDEDYSNFFGEDRV